VRSTCSPRSRTAIDTRAAGDPDAEARFQVLNAAYEVLKDPERRSRYDETGDEAERNDEDDVDMADFMSAFMHGNGFASGGWGQQRGPRRGPDALFDVDVTLEELYAGASKTLSVDKSVRCGLCTGSGGKAGRKRQTCSSCGGEGYVRALVSSLHCH
jgi:molecular chaperone DnaJ